MAKNSKTPRKSTEEKVAEITSRSSIVTALLGFLGVVIVALIGYFGSKSLPTTITNEFEVSSTSAWQVASVLKEGDMVRVIYKSGEWTNNKDSLDSSPYVDSIGYDPAFRKPFEDIIGGANLAALIGRIGDKYYIIGKQIEFQSPVSGNLELQMNDEGLSNNAGSIIVEIIIKR